MTFARVSVVSSLQLQDCRTLDALAKPINAIYPISQDPFPTMTNTASVLTCIHPLAKKISCTLIFSTIR
jgi:hypothetical protein